MFFRNAISARAAKRRMIDERPSIKVRKCASKAIPRYERETWFELDKHLDLQTKIDIVEGVDHYLATVEPSEPVDDADQHDNAYWNAPDDDTYFPDYMEIDSRRSSWVAAEKYILDLYPPGADEIDLAPPAA